MKTPTIHIDVKAEKPREESRINIVNEADVNVSVAITGSTEFEMGEITIVIRGKGE